MLEILLYIVGFFAFYLAGGILTARAQSARIWRDAQRKYYISSSRRHYRNQITLLMFFWPIIFVGRVGMALWRKSVRPIQRFIEAPVEKIEQETNTVAEATRFWKNERARLEEEKASPDQIRMAYDLWVLNQEKLQRLRSGR